MRKIVKLGKYTNAVSIPDEMSRKFKLGQQVAWQFDEKTGRWYLMTLEEFIDMTNRHDAPEPQPIDSRPCATCGIPRDEHKENENVIQHYWEPPRGDGTDHPGPTREV